MTPLEIMLLIVFWFCIWRPLDDEGIPHVLWTAPSLFYRHMVRRGQDLNLAQTGQETNSSVFFLVVMASYISHVGQLA